jgi:hypothetical protein
MSNATATNATTTDTNTNTNNDDTHGPNLPPVPGTAVGWPPGIQTIMKCEKDNSQENVDLTQLVIELLFKVHEKKLLEIPSGSRQNGPNWKLLYVKLYQEHHRVCFVATRNGV